MLPEDELNSTEPDVETKVEVEASNVPEAVETEEPIVLASDADDQMETQESEEEV